MDREFEGDEIRQYFFLEHDYSFSAIFKAKVKEYLVSIYTWAFFLKDFYSMRELMCKNTTIEMRINKSRIY